MDMKITMVKAFGWSLYDINQTDIVELLHFVRSVNGNSVVAEKPKTHGDTTFLDLI